jgi:hypothetical protein
MMRVFAKSLLVLAAVVWASSAWAISVDVTQISGTAPNALPSDEITVEISLDSGPEAQMVNFYFLSIGWSPALSLSGVDPGSQWMPNFGGAEWWAHLTGNLAVDAYGLELNGYDPGGKTTYRVFANDVLGTLVFHVIAPGEAIVTPYYGLGDIIGDDSYLAIPGVVMNSLVIATPEPTTTALLVLGMLGIAYAGRRR